MPTDRIPCINPRCRRTASAEKFGSAEIICSKCFRALPDALRKEHQRCWREIRKWERRIARTVDELRRGRMQKVVDRFEGLLDRNWHQIKDTFLSPDKPEGLDRFLQEMNL